MSLTERRRFDRTPAPPPRVIGRARLRPPWTRVHPGLHAGEWYPVLERNPDILSAIEGGLARPGYVWIDVPGKALHVWAQQRGRTWRGRPLSRGPAENRNRATT